MHSVFIDGSAGTTGLRISERLAGRGDIKIITLSESERKDPGCRRDAIRSSDVSVLCLPDDAAREAVKMAEGSGARIIDASTAHRTAPGWVYGFPELAADRALRIAQADRVAVPGCHASGFCAIVYPRVACGIMPADYPACVHSLTGYSGGGKKMIADYESDPREARAPAQYATLSSHKHLPEMQHVCGLDAAPLFSPIVCDFYSGMLVCVPLFTSLLSRAVTPEELYGFYSDYYAGKKLISVRQEPQNATLYADALSGRDAMEILISGCAERINVYARFCNLGKGASGAAVQCLNLMLGADETAGLVTG